MRAAAATMRPNPAFKAEDVIGTLGVGHALVSFLDAEGVPCTVQNTAIICPQSLMAPAPEDLRAKARAYDGMDRYDEAVDNLSAYEKLTQQQEADAERAALEQERAAAAKKKQEERRRAKIESQLISAGGQVLRRGLLNTLLKGLK